MITLTKNLKHFFEFGLRSKDSLRTGKFQDTIFLKILNMIRWIVSRVNQICRYTLKPYLPNTSKYIQIHFTISSTLAMKDNLKSLGFQNALVNSEGKRSSALGE